MLSVNWTNVWGITSGFWPLGVVFLFLAVYLLAKNDVIFGFVPEGQIKAVMKGDSLARLLVNIGGYWYDKDKRQIFWAKDPNHRPPETKWWQNWHPLGLYLIGLPLYHSVLTYLFSWNKWAKPEGEKEFDLIARDNEKTKSVFFRYPYGIKVKKIKVEGNVEVNIVLVVTVEVVHPERTLFRIQPTGNWLALVVAKVDEAVRGSAGSIDIKALRQLGAKSSAAANDLRTVILAQNGEPPVGSIEEESDGILKLCGVKIISVEFQNFEFDDAKVGVAFQSEEVNKQKAAGRRAEADGEAYFTQKTGNALAEVWNNQYLATGEAGFQAAMLADGTRNFPGDVLSYGAGGPLPTYQVGQVSPGSQTPRVNQPQGGRFTQRPPRPPNQPPSSPPTSGPTTSNPTPP